MTIYDYVNKTNLQNNIINKLSLHINYHVTIMLLLLTMLKIFNNILNK